MSIERLQIIDLELASSTSQLQALLLHETKRLEFKFELFSFSNKANMIDRIIKAVGLLDRCRVLQKSTETGGFLKSIQQYKWQISFCRDDAHCMFIVLLINEEGFSYTFNADMSDRQVLKESKSRFSSKIKQDDILLFAKWIKNIYDQKYSQHLNIEDFNELKKRQGYELLKTVCKSFVNTIQLSMQQYKMSRYNQNVHQPELYRLPLSAGPVSDIDAYKCFRYSTETEQKAIDMNLMQFISTVPEAESANIFNEMQSAMTSETVTVNLVSYSPLRADGRIHVVFLINCTGISNKTVIIHSRFQGNSGNNRFVETGMAWVVYYEIEKIDDA